MLESLNTKLKTTDPIYRQIAGEIKRSILSGETPSGSKLPSENELAARFGVNRLTLRKSLRLLEEQELIVQRRGSGTFVIHQAPRGKFHVGLIFSHVGKMEDNPYIGKVLTGVAGAMSHPAFGELSVIELSKEDDERSLSGKIARCDGLIAPGPDASQFSLFLSLAGGRVPTVFLSASDPRLTEAGGVCVDLTPGSMELAVRTLRELGHCRAGYIGTALPSCQNITRRESFFEAAERHGLEVPPEMRHTFEGSFFEEPRAAMRRMMLMRDPPTAVVSNTIAYGIAHAAAELGLRVPEDVSIIGFDGSSSVCPLTANLVQPVTEMAGKGCELLLRMLSTGKPPESRTYYYEARLDAARGLGPPRARPLNIRSRNDQQEDL